MITAILVEPASAPTPIQRGRKRPSNGPGESHRRDCRTFSGGFRLSDGGAHLSFLTSGCYGTEYIARFVRDEAITTLEQAHWRLSALPAHCAGFRDRGTLREGAAADVIVYDYGVVGYTDTEFVNDLPAGQMRTISRATGYRYTLVNGQVTVEDDQQTDTMAGHLLRHGKA